MSVARAEPGRTCWVPTRAELGDIGLDHLGLVDRHVVRAVAMLARSRLAGIAGLEHVLPDRDPFILVANHATKLEAILLPALLMLLRGGRHLHFMADWNFRMIPGVELLYRSARVIVVPNKPARPRWLNVLKPWLTSAVPPMEMARRHLGEGRPVGIFAEGTVNRDRVHLLPGRPGAARLSLQTGAPVVAVGLRYPEADPLRPIPEGSPMQIDIAPPMAPPDGGTDPRAVRAFHAQIMSAVAARSHKLSTAGTGDDHEGPQPYAQQTS